MSAVVETFLICDGHCGTNFGVDNRNQTVQQQRKDAKGNGWVYSYGKDLCPNCRPKRLDGKPHSSHKKA